MATHTTRTQAQSLLHPGWYIAAGLGLLGVAAYRTKEAQPGGFDLFSGWKLPRIFAQKKIEGEAVEGPRALPEDPQSAIERVNAYIDAHSSASVEEKFMGQPRITYFFDAEGNPDIKRQVSELRTLLESAGLELQDVHAGAPPEGTLLAYDVVRPGSPAGEEGVASISATVGKKEWTITLIDTGFFGF